MSTALGRRDCRHRGRRCSNTVVCVFIIAAMTVFLVAAFLVAATWLVSICDTSSVARLFCERDRCDAIDAIRGEGVQVVYWRWHYRRNGWAVLCIDDPSMDDARLIRLAPHLRKLAPKVLFLPKTNVGDQGIASLRDIKSIEFLDLGWTRIDNAGLKTLATLPSLKELYINNTKVDDAGLCWLQGLANLQLLDAGQTGVTDKGASRLSAILSGAYVSTSRR